MAGQSAKFRCMFNRQALGTFVIALALPAYADTPPELMHRLDQYPEVVHRLNQYPEVMRTGDQHSDTDVVEPKPLATAQIWMRMNANADVAYKTIGKLAGVTVVIDPDFRPQKITVHLTDVTAREALDTIGLLSKTVWRVVTPKIIFVYPKDGR
jgi:hypothetical protein